MSHDAISLLPPARKSSEGGPAKGATTDAAKGAKDAGAARARILVVDDEPDLREMLQLLLESEGYDVMVARDGLHAFEIIEDGFAPELIVLDLMMPRMNGWEVWDRLQATPRLAPIPVVVFTATGLGPGAIGGAHVMPKSTDATVLLDKIATLLDR